MINEPEDLTPFYTYLIEQCARVQVATAKVIKYAKQPVFENETKPREDLEDEVVDLITLLNMVNLPASQKEAQAMAESRGPVCSLPISVCSKLMATKKNL